MSEMDEVEGKIREALALPMAPRKVRLARAARLADLYEVQARLFVEAQAAEVIVPTVYRAACELAAQRLVDRSRFFRTQAGAR